MSQFKRRLFATTLTGLAPLYLACPVVDSLSLSQAQSHALLRALGDSPSPCPSLALHPSYAHRRRLSPCRLPPYQSQRAGGAASYLDVLLPDQETNRLRPQDATPKM